MRNRVLHNACVPSPVTDLFCAGGYILARALTRLVTDQTPDILPELLYRGLKLSPECLTLARSDAFWDTTLRLQFQSQAFVTASSWLAAAQRSGVNVLCIIDTSPARSAQSRFVPARKVMGVILVAHMCV